MTRRTTEPRRLVDPSLQREPRDRMRRSTQRNQNRRAQRDRLEFGARPTSHHEAIVARMFSSVVDQSVRFGQKKLLALRIEFRSARERELASVRKDALSKNGLALLTVPRRLPFANVQNQDAWTSKRPRERGKHRHACVVIHEVVENA